MKIQLAFISQSGNGLGTWFLHTVYARLKGVIKGLTCILYQSDKPASNKSSIKATLVEV